MCRVELFAKLDSLTDIHSLQNTTSQHENQNIKVCNTSKWHFAGATILQCIIADVAEGVSGTELSSLVVCDSSTSLLNDLGVMADSTKSPKCAVRPSVSILMAVNALHWAISCGNNNTGFVQN